MANRVLGGGKSSHSTVSLALCSFTVPAPLLAVPVGLTKTQRRVSFMLPVVLLSTYGGAGSCGTLVKIGVSSGERSKQEVNAGRGATVRRGRAAEAVIIEINMNDSDSNETSPRDILGDTRMVRIRKSHS